jgi:prolipoprotein diacylglyceryltransferase
MYPILFPWLQSAPLIHGLFVGLGFAVGGLIFISRARAASAWDDRFYSMLVGILIGGAVGARLSSMVEGAIHDGPHGLALAWEYGGRSILGGLAGAYVGAQIGKRIGGYKGHTGNFFAPAVAVGLAIGRIGCFLTEPPGRASALPWAIRIHPSVASSMPQCEPCQHGASMHPSFIYEIVFLLLCAYAMRRWGARMIVPGSLFLAFLSAYSGFRFLVEFTRVNPVNSWGLTGSQVFLIVMSPPIVWRLRAMLWGNRVADSGVGAS